MILTGMYEDHRKFIEAGVFDKNTTNLYLGINVMRAWDNMNPTDKKEKIDKMISSLEPTKWYYYGGAILFAVVCVMLLIFMIMKPNIWLSLGMIGAAGLTYFMYSSADEVGDSMENLKIFYRAS